MISANDKYEKLQGLMFWLSRIELVIEVTVWGYQFGVYKSIFKTKISTHPNFGTHKKFYPSRILDNFAWAFLKPTLKKPN